jgi:hypothetical protein
MSSIALNPTGTGRTPVSAWMTPWQAWGLILIVPYVLVFVFFVLYPIGYGFWLARRPETYAHLFEDPIFVRSVVNTLVFLIVAINLKMMIALLLSGFFVQARTWIKWLSVLFILPWAVPSIPTDHVAALHAQSRMGRDQPADLPADLRGRAELAQRSDHRARDGDAGAHLEVACRSGR